MTIRPNHADFHGADDGLTPCNVLLDIRNVTLRFSGEIA